MAFSIKILQVNTLDAVGGAARIALNLHEAYQEAGHDSIFAVGRKIKHFPAVISIRDDYARKKGVVGCLPSFPHRFSPRYIFNRIRGLEHFNFPASRALFESNPRFIPDIIHCHNLHGNYFDLRILPRLCRIAPVVLSLHDSWLLGGNCAHPFDCDRWKTGCGSCPDITIPPGLLRDGTARNWTRKREIFARSSFNVVTPSQWLMDKAVRSILRLGMASGRVIPNGVDIEIFRPGDQSAARSRLGLPSEAEILLFVACGIKKHQFKHFEMLQRVIAALGASSKRPILFLALGEEGEEIITGNSMIRFVPFQNNPAEVAAYYQAADVYLHAARAENFPTTILEALACGRPVVATANGGIPEQIREGVTGFLVPPGDDAGMTRQIRLLLENERLRSMMGQAAADSAQRNFSLGSMTQTYLEYYLRIIQEQWGKNV